MIKIKTFLIQTVNGQVVHDFSFTLIEAIKYNNWFYNKQMYNYILSDTTNRPRMDNGIQYYLLEDIIPIGTVEFILEYLKRWYYIDNVKPLNIPEQLQKDIYLNYRGYTNTIERKTYPWLWLQSQSVFIKSVNKIKGYTNIVPYNQIPTDDDYTISEVIDIDSEWRGFVFNNKLVGLQNYLGDFTLFPNVEIIENMIKDFNYNSAYTLDVGVNKDGTTFIIECHDFFSCGLYGFSDYKQLPLMFITTFNKIKRSN